ncbi:hypothetical protein M5K25_017668 [Dendrobium thyrsiflorum]|uniref:Uncharacterized protein n=1 Tax=Dendrobium thyrsiflorum TaxID=117978 RepID=A0ABD0UN65_DENTH
MAPITKLAGKCLVRKRYVTNGVEIWRHVIYVLCMFLLLHVRPPFPPRLCELTGPGRDKSGIRAIAEEPETDATDGNVGEGRRELPAVADPASSSLNATLETFTQMMATMTQMLKNIQAPASGSGGGPIGGSSGKCLVRKRYVTNGVEIWRHVIYVLCMFLLLHVRPPFPPRLCELTGPGRDIVFNNQGQVDIIQSPFFDVNLEVDQIVEGYIDRIIFSLTAAIDDQLSSVHCPPEELVSASKRLWTVIESAIAGQPGAILAKASNPTMIRSTDSSAVGSWPKETSKNEYSPTRAQLKLKSNG